MSITDELFKADGGVEDTSLKLASMNSDFIAHKKPQNHRSITSEKMAHPIEDIFGKFYDQKGNCHTIKRYTWRNQNKIEVQVINYGARITSIKMPDRKGAMEDIILGFDDLAGYIYNKNHYFGATIGRTTSAIVNRTFILGKERIKLRAHNHSNGGEGGFDQQVFNTYVQGNQVIMTHLSPDLLNGYPGDLLLQIKFELSNKNEFKIKMEAQTTRPTIINLSNLLYFNLAGHHTGPDEIYKHSLTLNCDCFTQTDDGMPTGQICNVIYTPYDFQVPVSLGKVMGIQPHDGFDQYLCINKGVEQDDCFVGRVFHPPSGRLLEIYSNQPGVHLTTANEFGSGYIQSMDEIMEGSNTPRNFGVDNGTSDLENILKFFKKIYQSITEVLEVDKDKDYLEIRKLITMIRQSSATIDECKKNIFKIMLTPLQWQYLNCMLVTRCDNEDEVSCQKLRKLVNKILDDAEVHEPEGSAILKPPKKQSSVTELREYVKKLKNAEDFRKKQDRCVHDKNKIPSWYTGTDQIRGKDRAVYRMHGGIALQTQNYPSSINFPKFPSCVLNPGQAYEHNITYKFWIRAGNPQKWVKRNLTEKKQKEKLSKSLIL